MKLIKIFILACLASSSICFGENWPHWRGPDANGVSPETGLPTNWGDDKNVLWKVELGGQGVSSPVVWGDLVMVSSQRGRGLLRGGNHPTLTSGDAAEKGLSEKDSGDSVTFLIEAFGLSDGKQAWSFAVDAEGDLAPVHEKHNLASPSVVTDGSMVYGWFGTGQLVALDLKGKLVWSRHLGREYSPFEIAWGHSASPTIFEDLLILLCDHEPASYLLALDKSNGQERWKVDRGKGLRSYSTPVVVRGAQGPELIVNSSERVDAYNPRTGEFLWHTGGSNRFPIPVPSAEGEVLYMSRGYRSGPYMAVRTGGRGDVSKSHVIWEVPTGAPYVSSIIQYQGVVYMANDQGIFRAVDATNGETLWQSRLGGFFSASPVAGDGKVYFVGESGETVVLKAGKTEQVLARNRLSERLLASPALAQGKLLLRSDSSLICIQE